MNELLTCAVRLDSRIVAYILVQFVVMLIELKEVLSVR